MIAVGTAERRNANGVPSAGLSAWATTTLDGALGSGRLDAEVLVGMNSAALTELARKIVAAQLDRIDLAGIVRKVKS